MKLPCHYCRLSHQRWQYSHQKKARRNILVIIVVIIAAGFAVISFLRARGQQAALAGLQTTPAQRGDLTATVGATGVVRANQTAVLAWLTTGTVGEVSVVVGESVAKDQELASLEQTSLPQNVILAQVDLINAQMTLQNLLEGDPLAALKALQAVSQSEQAVLEAEGADDRFEDPSWDFKLEQAEVRVDETLETLEAARQEGSWSLPRRSA